VKDTAKTLQYWINKNPQSANYYNKLVESGWNPNYQAAGEALIQAKIDKARARGVNQWGDPYANEVGILQGYKAIDPSPYATSYVPRDNPRSDTKYTQYEVDRGLWDRNPSLRGQRLYDPNIDKDYVIGGTSGAISKTKKEGFAPWYVRPALQTDTVYDIPRNVRSPMSFKEFVLNKNVPDAPLSSYKYNGKSYFTPESLAEAYGGGEASLAVARSQFKTNKTKKIEAEKRAAEQVARRKAKGGAFKRFISSPIGMAVGTALTAGFGSAFAPALFGAGAAGATGATTGISAGGATAGTSTLGTALGSFAKKAAIKGALSGGLQGYLGGGDLKSALRGAGIGGLTGGYGGSIASGLGLSGAGASAFTGALSGAGSRYAGSGKLKDALSGAVMGGLGGYAGSRLSSGQENYINVNGEEIRMPIKKPSGLSRALGGISGAGKQYGINLGTVGDLGSALFNYKTAKDIEDEILESQRLAKEGLAPYEAGGRQAQARLKEALASGELGGDFNYEEDPGYQYRLSQAEQALARRQAASGGYFSGRALKEVSELGQGMAAQGYQDAYNRDLARQRSLYQMLSGQAAQGLNTAGAIGNIDIQGGRSRAESKAYRSNLVTDTLSRLLRGYQNRDEYDNRG